MEMKFWRPSAARLWLNLHLPLVAVVFVVLAVEAEAGWKTMFTKVPVVPRPREIAEKSGVYVVLAGRMFPGDVTWRTDASIRAEGYRLEVSPNGIIVTAGDDAGRFYAKQTLRQLATTVGDAQVIPSIEIDDWPAFAWRGVHLDECRHFFGKETVKTILDLMAFHKLNVFHWHLTDDQGWRIDVPGFPELVRYGAVRPKSPRHGLRAADRNKDDDDIYTTEPYGPFFYTKEDLREIVAYARERHITIVPEVEFPGHLRAALAAHPEFSCVGPALEPRHPWCKWGISKDVLCAGNPEAIHFLEHVFDYVCDVFPGTYVHIGGDECPTTRWETCPKCQARMRELGLPNERALQGELTRHFTEYLARRGKRAVGWDEMLSANPPIETIAMNWRGKKGGAAAAAAAGRDVVMSPAGFCYFDACQGLKSDVLQYMGGYLPVATVFKFDPTDGVPTEAHAHVLGGQCNNWTEYTWNHADLIWKMWPRACAMAEALWTKPEDSYNGCWPFLQRLWKHRDRLVEMGYGCATME